MQVKATKSFKEILLLRTKKETERAKEGEREKKRYLCERKI